MYRCLSATKEMTFFFYSRNVSRLNNDRNANDDSRREWIFFREKDVSSSIGPSSHLFVWETYSTTSSVRHVSVMFLHLSPKSIQACMERHSQSRYFPADIMKNNRRWRFYSRHVLCYCRRSIECHLCQCFDGNSNYRTKQTTERRHEWRSNEDDGMKRHHQPTMKQTLRHNRAPLKDKKGIWKKKTKVSLLLVTLRVCLWITYRSDMVCFKLACHHSKWSILRFVIITDIDSQLKRQFDWKEFQLKNNTVSIQTVVVMISSLLFSSPMKEDKWLWNSFWLSHYCLRDTISYNRQTVVVVVYNRKSPY